PQSACPSLYWALPASPGPLATVRYSPSPRIWLFSRWWGNPSTITGDSSTRPCWPWEWHGHPLSSPIFSAPPALLRGKYQSTFSGPACGASLGSAPRHAPQVGPLNNAVDGVTRWLQFALTASTLT